MGCARHMNGVGSIRCKDSKSHERRAFSSTHCCSFQLHQWWWWSRDEPAKGLYLPKTFLTGILSTSLGRYESLNELQMGQNKLSGSIPTAWRTTRGVGHLSHHSRQHLVGPVPSEIRSLVRLERMDFSSNRLNGNHYRLGIPLVSKLGPQ